MSSYIIYHCLNTTLVRILIYSDSMMLNTYYKIHDLNTVEIWVDSSNHFKVVIDSGTKIYTINIDPSSNLSINNLNDEYDPQLISEQDLKL